MYNDAAALNLKSDKLYLSSCWRRTGKQENPDAEYRAQSAQCARLFESIHQTQLTFPMNPRRSGSRATQMPDRKRYIKSVHKIKQYIAAGDIYQANLSQRFEVPLDIPGWEYFDRLRKLNPAPYACYMKFPKSGAGTSGWELSGCSPELLIKKRGQRVETRPIAGTRPRGRNPGQDRRMSSELLLSEKERAEHVMLVDLERNDLGRVCVPGSVRVTESMAIERYSHVMHIVSHVAGTLRPSVDFFRAVEAVFPGGTITGCPKIRCMEILDELEPVKRGMFFGSAGWFGFQGDGELNLLIRTGIVQDGRLFLQTGSGIVADSDPDKEYEESLHKARALLTAAQH